MIMMIPQKLRMHSCRIISFKYVLTTSSFFRSLNTILMCFWNVHGVPLSPKGIRSNFTVASSVTNAVLFLASGVSGICKNSLDRSNVVKIMPCD